MTVHDLHDALNLLPSDLITAADQVRTAPKVKIILWKRMLPVAACFVLLVGLGLMLRGEDTLGHMMKSESAPETPAAMAPVSESQKITADEAIPEEPAAKAPAEEGGASNSTAMGGDEKPVEEELHIDHSHSFEEDTEARNTTAAYCGNMLTTIYMDEMNVTLAGSDSVKITDIMIHLDYEPDRICRCMAEFTVDTEMISGIQVNLTEAFARCEKGQAALTEEQVATLRKIIESLQ